MALSRAGRQKIVKTMPLYPRTPWAKHCATSVHAIALPGRLWWAAEERRHRLIGRRWSLRSPWGLLYITFCHLAPWINSNFLLFNKIHLKVTPSLEIYSRKHKYNKCKPNTILSKNVDLNSIVDRFYWNIYRSSWSRPFEAAPQHWSEVKVSHKYCCRKIWFFV